MTGPSRRTNNYLGSLSKLIIGPLDLLWYLRYGLQHVSQCCYTCTRVTKVTRVTVMLPVACEGAAGVGVVYADPGGGQHVATAVEVVLPK